MKATSTHWRGPNTLGQDDLKSWMGRVPGVQQGRCTCVGNYITLVCLLLSTTVRFSS